MEIVISIGKSEYSSSTYSYLVDTIGHAIADGQRRMGAAINSAMLEPYWKTGEYIVEFEQKDEDRTTYGEQLLSILSRDLKLRYGKKFSFNNLYNIRKFYRRFPIFQTVSGKLSGSYYSELLKLENENEQNFKTL